MLKRNNKGILMSKLARKRREQQALILARYYAHRMKSLDDTNKLLLESLYEYAAAASLPISTVNLMESLIVNHYKKKKATLILEETVSDLNSQLAKYFRGYLKFKADKKGNKEERMVYARKRSQTRV